MNLWDYLMIKCEVKVKNKGFSILELMLVIAIIAIIVAIAIPMYSNYQVRAKLSSADIKARVYINEIVDHTYQTGEFPSAGSNLWGCENINESYVRQVCKVRTDSENAVVTVYVDQNLVPDVNNPYYQYDLALV